VEVRHDRLACALVVIGAWADLLSQTGVNHLFLAVLAGEGPHESTTAIALGEKEFPAVTESCGSDDFLGENTSATNPAHI
jgi:hypothetical protein